MADSDTDADDPTDSDDSDDDADDGGAPARRVPAAGRGTSPPRPASARAGVAGAVRVVRDVGTSRLLPSDPEAREALNLRLRRAGT